MIDSKNAIRQTVAPTTTTPILQPDPKAPTETTRLLLPDDSSEVSATTQNVHYQNVSGIQFRWLFGCLMLASLVAFFDGTLMASSHPIIASYFQASNSASWLSTVFFLTLTVFQPMYGRVSDLIGRRHVLLFALVVFFLGTGWCAAAPDMGSFIAARALCGLGAGGVAAMTVILVNDVVRLEYRGIYQSYYNVAWGLGNGLGAALGGVLCDQLGWRAAFGIQLPFIFAIGIVAWIVTPSNLGPNLAKSEIQTFVEAAQAFDIPGAFVLTVTITSLTLSLNLPGTVLPWTHPIVLISLATFLISSCFLLHVEYYAPRPILPLSHLSTPPMLNLMWSNFLSATTINTVLFYLPLYLQAVRELSPTASGLYLLIPLASASAAGLISGLWITNIRKTKPPILAGSVFFLLGAISTTVLCINPTTATTISPWAIALLIPGTSIAQGMNWSATTIAVLTLPGPSSKPASSSPDGRETTPSRTTTSPSQSTTTTTLALIRSIGSTLGIAFSSWIFQVTLLYYLNQNITSNPEGTTKQALIDHITHASISAIATLPPLIKAQAIASYVQALRLTFASGIIGAVGGLLLVVAVRDRLPSLKRESKEEDEEEEEESR
ncbi:MFS general substrate transporter [Rhizodiscina lignyota]|uniref:MFS general substrate transporter n=1 Tax=Rhizodiscina lignyota TaxID=1504668 RepID=A0A9P4M2P5_9PEZI|nr:MFS general substrate transporter [Rhizodiscina lignyota]